MSDNEKNTTEKTKKEPRKVTFVEAVILLIVVVAIMIWSTLIAKVPTAMGILLCGVLCCLYGWLVLHQTWEAIFGNVLTSVQRAMGAIFFLMLGGAIGGTWIASGTVPFLMYWGLKLLHPSFLVVVTYLILSIVSLSTGRAWATTTTIGLALGGVAAGLGVPLPLVAGAAVSGAFLGDKWSPVGDVQGLTAGLSGLTTIETFRAMISTTGLGALIAGVLYMLVGFRYTADSVNVELVSDMLSGLSTFNLSILVLLPLLVMIGLCAFTKLPITPVVFGSIAVAMILAVVLQGRTFPEILGVFWNGAVTQTGIESIDSMLTKGGVMSFAPLIMMLFCAFVFAGSIGQIGVLDAFAEKLLSKVKRRGTLILASSITSVLGVYLTSSVYVSQILNFNMYEKGYKKFGLHRVNLARTVTDCAPMFGSIVPWSAGAVLAAGAFEISTWSYAPYVWACYIPIILGIIYGYTRKSTKYYVPLDEEPAVEVAETAS